MKRPTYTHDYPQKKHIFAWLFLMIFVIAVLMAIKANAEGNDMFEIDCTNEAYAGRCLEKEKNPYECTSLELAGNCAEKQPIEASQSQEKPMSHNIETGDNSVEVEENWGK